MRLWGTDLVSVSVFNPGFRFGEYFSIFDVSSVIYMVAMLLLTRAACWAFFPRKKYAWLALSILTLVPFFIGFRYLLEEVIFKAIFGQGNYHEGTVIGRYIGDNIQYAIGYITLGALVFLFENNIKNQQKLLQMAATNSEAELKFLRSQINPHFLFNSLNNIYTLIYEKSDKAPDAFLKLTELTRYMSYEKGNMVNLSTEVKYLESYIALQKLRFDYELSLVLEVDEAVLHHQLPPYTLIAFVENAFKHGDFKEPNFPLKIIATGNAANLKIMVSNKISTHEKDATGGVGLDNVRRRLELLFPDRHRFSVEKTDGVFTVRLHIQQAARP